MYLFVYVIFMHVRCVIPEKFRIQQSMCFVLVAKDLHLTQSEVFNRLAHVFIFQTLMNAPEYQIPAVLGLAPSTDPMGECQSHKTVRFTSQ